MSDVTLADLVSVIRECAGDSDVADLDGDILDTTFEDLGYDSIALLEVSAKLQQDLGVEIAEGEMDTPRNTLLLINERLLEVSS